MNVCMHACFFFACHVTKPLQFHLLLVPYQTCHLISIPSVLPESESDPSQARPVLPGEDGEPLLFHFMSVHSPGRCPAGASGVDPSSEPRSSPLLRDVLLSSPHLPTLPHLPFLSKHFLCIY